MGTSNGYYDSEIGGVVQVVPFEHAAPPTAVPQCPEFRGEAFLGWGGRCCRMK
jgi:hypothetical protein